jgi:hypothetical protein
MTNFTSNKEGLKSLKEKKLTSEERSELSDYQCLLEGHLD